MKDSIEISNIFKALCDPNRVFIIQLLQNGEKCACDISSELGLMQSKLSYHMKILCDSKIVDSWYEGKWTHYKISKTGSFEAIKILTDLIITKENET